MLLKNGATKEMKLGNMIAYGVGDFFGGGCYAILGLWLMFFYTTYAGLSPMETGAILAIARVFSAVLDPVMGYITDNFYRTKLGQRYGRRGFFFILGIPAMLVYASLWVSGFGFWYYLITYLAFDIVYSMVIVPYETLAAEMTNDFKVRSKLTGVRMLFSTGAGILAAWVPGLLISTFGEKSPLSFLYMGLIFTCLFSLGTFILWRFTWERRVEIKGDEPTINFLQDMKRLVIELASTMRVKTFRHHVGMYTGGFVANDILGSVFTYFVVFVLMQSSVLASRTLTIMSIVQFCFVPIFIRLCLKIGNGASYKLAQIVFILGVLSFVGIYLFHLNQIVFLIYLAGAIIGIAKSGIFYICWNIYSFMADVDEVLTGRRREGIFAGIMTFVRKAVQAVALFLVGVVLEEFGFISGSTLQSPQAINGVVTVFFVGTFIFLIFGFLVSLRFKLTQKNHTTLVNEVERLKKGGSMADVDSHTKKVVEDLTGWPYEQNWGNNNVGYDARLKHS
ncbi:MFS transporter [Paenibacillus sp. TH7-28]